MNISQRILSVCLGICSFLVFFLISWISLSPVVAKSCMNFLGSYDTPGHASGVAVVGMTAYVADGSNGLQIIDVSRPSAPKLLGNYDTPYNAKGVAVVGTIAYVADYGSGLQIIDVSTPSAPKLLGSYATPAFAENVAVVGMMAYVADYDSGLLVIDVSTPSAPKLLGNYDTPGYAFGVAVVGTTAYVADHDSGLLVIDVSTPSAPKLLGNYATPYNADNVTVVGTTAYVADGSSGLQIIDVSKPSAPKLLGSYDTPGYAENVAVVGTIAYVADYDSGLQIIDVSTPSAPKLLGNYATPGSVSVAVVGTTAYVADWDSGLQIINISDCGSGNKPTVKTKPATHITDYYATLNGIVNGHGLTTRVWFQYGTTSGSYKSNSSKKTVKGSSNKKVNISIDGLSSQTTYYYRIVARNKDGTSYGDEKSFTTQDGGSSCKYVGTCKGTFSGDDYGTWNATIDNNCKMSGSGYSDKYDESFKVTVDVTSEGKFDLTLDYSGLSGKINSSNNISGTWWNDYSGISGTFKGVFIPQ